MVVIINNCIANGYFPKKWKEAEIIPLQKKKNPESPNDYRPISLLSNLGKILEEVIILKMKDEDGEVKGTPENQFAYRPRNSAVNAVEIITAEAGEAQRLEQTIGICSLDVAKAFDSVWKEGLVYKVEKSGENGKILETIASFMNERRASVKVKDHRTEWFPLSRGVPQGSKLGPILFNIYTADIQVKYTDTEGNVKYAGNTLIQARRKPTKVVKKIEEYTKYIADQMENWGIKLNESKTEIVLQCYGNGKVEKKNCRMIRREGIKVNGVNCIPKKSMKYLVIVINERGDATDTINHGIGKMNAIYGKTKYILKDKARDIKVKRLCYKQLIRPTVIYGRPAWQNVVEADIEKLNVAERKILRGMTGLHRKDNRHYYKTEELYKSSGIKEKVGDVIERLHVKHLKKREDHPNKWFVDKVEELKDRKMKMKMRNMDYKEHTKIWKNMGCPWNETEL